MMDGGPFFPCHLPSINKVTDQGVGALIFALAIGVISRAYLKSIVPLPYTVQVLVVSDYMECLK